MGEKGNVLEGSGTGLGAGVGGADAGAATKGVAGADAGPGGPVHIAGTDASQVAGGPDLGAIAGAGGAVGTLGMVAAAKRRGKRSETGDEASPATADPDEDDDAATARAPRDDTAGQAR